MEKGLVSIITPMYNSEKYIEATYKSIRNQTYKNWEWIVINDNSFDKSFDIVQQLSKTDSRIILINNTKNLKASKSRNKGMDIARGEYITFIDSDDLWKSIFLEKQIELLKSKNVNIVYSSYDRVSEDLRKKFGKYKVPRSIELKDLLKTNYMSCLTVIYKKNKFKNVRFNESLKMHEDFVMWLELINIEKVIYANTSSLAIYRIRKNSVSRNKFKNLNYMIYIMRVILKFNTLKIIYYIFSYSLNGLKKNIFLGR